MAVPPETTCSGHPPVERSLTMKIGDLSRVTAGGEVGGGHQRGSRVAGRAPAASSEPAAKLTSNGAAGRRRQHSSSRMACWAWSLGRSGGLSALAMPAARAASTCSTCRHCRGRPCVQAGRCGAAQRAQQTQRTAQGRAAQHSTAQHVAMHIRAPDATARPAAGDASAAARARQAGLPVLPQLLLGGVAFQRQGPRGAVAAADCLPDVQHAGVLRLHQDPGGRPAGAVSGAAHRHQHNRCAAERCRPGRPSVCVCACARCPPRPRRACRDKAAPSSRRLAARAAAATVAAVLPPACTAPQ